VQALRVEDSDTTMPGWQLKLNQIAQHHLDVATLRERGDGAFDDYTLGVAALSAALTAAYRAGIAAGESLDCDLDLDDSDSNSDVADPAPREPQQIGSGETPGERLAIGTKAAEAAFGVGASSLAAVSANAPEAAQIASGEAPANAPGEFAPVAPDPAETAPGGSEND
jgi:hypothetical protein